MKEHCEKHITVLEDNSFFTSYKFVLDTGYGFMISYHLFPGVDLAFMDFNAEDCNQVHDIYNCGDYILINHCKNGRFETIFKDRHIYLSEGDLVFSSGANSYTHNFTLGYYKGLQIIIKLSQAQKSIDTVIGKDMLDLRQLSNEIKENGSFAITRFNKEVGHVISELYDVDENIKWAYYKLKVVELLLFLKSSEIKSLEEGLPQLKDANVKKIKEIRSYIIEHIDEDITLDDLSKRFKIGKTSLKKFFRIIYGKPVITWRREYRMNKAAIYLENTDMGVSEISKRVGYLDHSKFTKAFKKYFGMTPLKYRHFKHN